MKKDKYFRARGSTTRLLDIHCAGCNTFVLQYQKDGVGNLLRCYLNRIIVPPKLADLQVAPLINEPRDMPNLVCPHCKSIIGTPMRYDDGRLAFRLVKGAYSKKIAKGKRS